MAESTGGYSPNLDPDLLLTHLEYAGWAVRKTFAMLEKLPAESVTKPVVRSFTSILATRRHRIGKRERREERRPTFNSLFGHGSRGSAQACGSARNYQRT